VKPRHVFVLVGGLGLGLGSLAAARAAPAGSLAGASTLPELVLVGAGAALVACGVAAWARRPGSRFGPTLAAAGGAWLAAELNNPQVGSPLLFTIGLVASAAAPALVAHAALAYPDGRLAGAPARAGVVLAYACTLLALGLLPALAFDPGAQGCTECPRNLLAVADAPGFVESASRVGLVLGLIWAPALAALALARVVRASSAARLLTAPVLLAAVVYLALVTATYAHGVGRGFLSNDTVDHRLWLWQGAALIGLALGVASAWARGRRARTRVARLVIELSDAPALGGLRDALARALDDPSLEVAYPLEPGRHVDARGRPVALPDAGGRAVTPLVRGGRPVAVLVHRADLLDDAALLEDVGAAASLALEHERLQAEARAQLDRLRASRARTVEASDAARRRLERDLHDGAQQRLVVLSFALRLLRAHVGGEAAGRVDAAEAELRDALHELRELARGIYPAVLVDEGLATALDALAEVGSAPITIEPLPDGRFAAGVEAAVYFLVAELVRRADATGVRVRAQRAEDRLLVEVDSGGDLDGDVVDLEDRIGALDGTLVVARAPSGTTTVRVEIPCGS
jgi:signal transduction histidine kinase